MLFLKLFLFLALLIPTAVGQNLGINSAGGTLVVAVPVRDGLVACSDKRLYNETTGTFRDDYVKIHKVNDNALFVATNTTGFLDSSTGRMDFDIFKITERYATQHPFVPGTLLWNGLKKEIRDQLLQYLSKRKFEDWPATDTANNKLLFNLIFYSIDRNTIRSYTLRTYYEKARTPVIYIPDVVSEIVKNPKLSGKGREVMAYIAIDPSFARDPSILRFDPSRFDPGRILVPDAVDFAKKLFKLTNSAIPQAQVSETYDCAFLGFQHRFQWIDPAGSLVNQ